MTRSTKLFTRAAAAGLAAVVATALAACSSSGGSAKTSGAASPTGGASSSSGRRRRRPAGQGQAGHHDGRQELQRGVSPRRAVLPGAASPGLHGQAQGQHRQLGDHRQGDDQRPDRHVPRVHRRDLHRAREAQRPPGQRAADLRRREEVGGGARVHDLEPDAVPGRRRPCGPQGLRVLARQPQDDRGHEEGRVVHLRRSAGEQDALSGRRGPEQGVRPEPVVQAARRSVRSTRRSTRRRSTRSPSSPPTASWPAGSTPC